MNIIARHVSKDGRVKGKPPILEKARVRHLKNQILIIAASSRQHPVLHGDVLFTRAELLLPWERHAHSCEVTDRMCNVIIYFAQMRGGPQSDHAVIKCIIFASRDVLVWLIVCTRRIGGIRSYANRQAINLHVINRSPNGCLGFCFMQIARSYHN